jgi:Polyketide cyclase / dehydrase and lipid transport
MRLRSSILIRRTPEEVGQFLAEIGNIEKWDRGVGSARAVANSPGEGCEFETPGRSDEAGAQPERARMGYRVVCAEPDHCIVALTSSTGNARFFQKAQWDFRLAPGPGGSILTCCAEFTLRMRYIFLAPVLYLKKSAIQFDLESLKQAIEQSE